MDHRITFWRCAHPISGSHLPTTGCRGDPVIHGDPKCSMTHENLSFPTSCRKSDHLGSPDHLLEENENPGAKAPGFSGLYLF
jgi:hypothetical protein